MKSANDIWGELGDLPEDEVMHVMTKLFATYEDQLQKDPKSEAALSFSGIWPTPLNRPASAISTEGKSSKLEK